MYTQDFFELPHYASPERICYDDFGCGDVLCEDETNINGEEMDSCSCSSNSGCSTVKTQLPIRGKKGAQYMRHGAFCLNSQTYPEHVRMSDYVMSFL